MEQLMRPNDPAARQQLRKALEQVQQRKQQMVQQRQQQTQPQNQPAQKEEERQPDGLKEGQRVAAAPGAEWQAGLPERERAALLSARQAKFDARMEEAVKRYYLELAK
jgi:TolA-binding protein